MKSVEIPYLLARWYDNKSALEDLRVWGDLKKPDWYGDPLEEKQRFLKHFDDIVEDIGPAEISRRERTSTNSCPRSPGSLTR